MTAEICYLVGAAWCCVGIGVFSYELARDGITGIRWLRVPAVIFAWPVLLYAVTYERRHLAQKWRVRW